MIPRRTVLALLVAASIASAKTEWVRQRPQGGLYDVKVKVAGKERTYCALDGDTPARLTVRGPARLRAYVRLTLSAADAETVPFGLVFEVDGRAEPAEERTAKRSKTAAIPGDAEHVPGVRHALYLDLPTGTHSVALRLREKGRVALAAFYLPKGKRKYTEVSMSPTEYQETAAEVYKERERTWYLGGGGKGVGLELIGPTKVTVRTSLEFGPSLRGEQAYTIAVLMDGAPTRDFALSTQRSEVRSWRDRAEAVPGVEKAFTVAVPEGRHTLSFLLQGTEAKACAYRFLIPARDAARER